MIVAAVLAGVYLLPEEKTVINEIVMTWLPYFVFIMYAINRGTNFTQALFMNCDHSLLTYSFYKQPSFILRLFQIRLREIMKINAVPALVIGIGLALILFATGRGNPFGAPVPTVKIASNALLARKKPNWIDFDAQGGADDDFFRLVLAVASGARTKNEQNGCRDIAIFRDGVIL